MRASLLLASALLLGACGYPSERVPLYPPPRLPAQVHDMPPREFLYAPLVVSSWGSYRPYCFHVDELLTWLDREDVDEQTWTLLADGRWRLDGYDPKRQERTVWIFEQVEDGVELVEYKDSDIPARTQHDIMRLYHSHLYNMHSDPIRARYGGCKPPYG
jgi:hypothetical protein